MNLCVTVFILKILQNTVKYIHFYLQNTDHCIIFVPIIENKVKVKEMEKTKKDYKAPFKGMFLIIGVRLNCTPQYVSMVLHGRLGKYTDRDTELVKKIRANATEIEELLRPQK